MSKDFTIKIKTDSEYVTLGVWIVIFPFLLALLIVVLPLATAGWLIGWVVSRPFWFIGWCASKVGAWVDRELEEKK